MEWLTEKWDRLTLAVVAVIVLTVGVLFVKKSLAYPDIFKTESHAEDGSIPIQTNQVTRVVNATNFVTNEGFWVLPIRGEGEAKKPLPLFVSIPIVEAGGLLIDMNDSGAQLVRQPASNKWLLDNNLDFLDASVLEQDPDGDGFNNLEEWEAKTSPKDAGSHPSYAEKIHLVARFAQNYTLTFSSKLDAERFQITREQTANYPRDTSIMKLGDTSNDGKFRLDKYEQLEGTNDLGIKVDTSKVTITYLETGKQHQLTRRVPETIPTYYAKLKFELSGKPTWEEFVKLGDTFKLPIDQETEYKLNAVTAEEAEITFQPEPGQEKTVKIKPKS